MFPTKTQQQSSVQFSSVPWPIGSVGEHEGRFSTDPLPVFSAGGPCEQFWHGQGCPLFYVVHPTYPLPTKALPTLRGTLKDDFEEAVMANELPEPWLFQSLDSTNNRFLWTHKKVDLALHPVVDLVLQVGDAEKLPHALGFASLDPLCRVSEQGPCFTAMVIMLLLHNSSRGCQTDWSKMLHNWHGMPELLTVASCRKDRKRISAESSIWNHPRWPNLSRHWTELTELLQNCVSECSWSGESTHQTNFQSVTFEGFISLVLLACRMRVTVNDSCLCPCVPLTCEMSLKPY